MSKRSAEELRKEFSMPGHWHAHVVIATIVRCTVSRIPDDDDRIPRTVCASLGRLTVKTEDIECVWGPFEYRDDAESCVKVLAARDDISSAVIVWLPAVED